jgi:hypothetical protein
LEKEKQGEKEMSPFETTWRLLKYNEADEDWYRFGGGKGSHVLMEDGEPVHYYSSSPCPTCGGTEGWHDDEEGNTHHWCGYNANIGAICGDCHSPINDMNPPIERIQTMEMIPHIKAMREAKGLKAHHPSGCLRCLEQHRTTGKLPYTIEQQAMGFPYNPDVHWRKEDLDDDTEILRSDTSKDLRDWFKEEWVDVSRKDKSGKHPPCGRSEAKLDSKGYPKCRPSKKVNEDTPKTSRSMSAKEKKSATTRKRRKQQGVGGKPTMVKSCDCETCNALVKAMVTKSKKEKPFHGYNPKKHSRKGGLNAKGRAKFKREEGANLKPPVTEKPSTLKPGSKKAKRRKSFCARMSGVKGPTSKGGKLTPKGAALKRWNC